MASKKSLTLTVRISGVRETLRAFKDMPKEANDALRNAANQISKALAASAQAAGRGRDKQSAAVAATVKAVRDRVPVVQVGGATRVTSTRTPVFKLLFGSEFGATRYPQFKPHRGTKGYWFFPTVEREDAMIDREWNGAVDQIIMTWGAGSK